MRFGEPTSFRELLDPPVPVAPACAGFRPLRVTDVVAESATVASVYLAADEPLPAPVAWQYPTVRVAGAVRTYWLSSAPDAGTYRTSVKREPNGLVSGYLHELAPGIRRRGTRNCWRRCRTRTSTCPHRVGRPTHPVNARQRARADRATAYVCGPERFMTDIGGMLAALGVTDVRTELFGSRPAINPVSPARHASRPPAAHPR